MFRFPELDECRQVTYEAIRDCWNAKNYHKNNIIQTPQPNVSNWEFELESDSICEPQLVFFLGQLCDSAITKKSVAYLWGLYTPPLD